MCAGHWCFSNCSLVCWFYVTLVHASFSGLSSVDEDTPDVGFITVFFLGSGARRRCRVAGWSFLILSLCVRFFRHLCVLRLWVESSPFKHRDPETQERLGEQKAIVNPVHEHSLFNHEHNLLVAALDSICERMLSGMRRCRRACGGMGVPSGVKEERRRRQRLRSDSAARATIGSAFMSANSRALRPCGETAGSRCRTLSSLRCHGCGYISLSAFSIAALAFCEIGAAVSSFGAPGRGEQSCREPR